MARYIRCEQRSASLKHRQFPFVFFHPSVRTALPQDLDGLLEFFLCFALFPLPLEEFSVEGMIQSELKPCSDPGIRFDGLSHPVLRFGSIIDAELQEDLSRNLQTKPSAALILFSFGMARKESKSTPLSPSTASHLAIPGSAHRAKDGANRSPR